MFKNKKSEVAEGEEMFFDAKEFHSSNQQVANILSSKPQTQKINEDSVEPEV